MVRNLDQTIQTLLFLVTIFLGHAVAERKKYLLAISLVEMAKQDQSSFCSPLGTSVHASNLKPYPCFLNAFSQKVFLSNLFSRNGQTGPEFIL
jgi:hypothetical protein